MGEVGDAEDEADGVEDVGFAGAVEAGDGVEVGIEAVGVWMEREDGRWRWSIIFNSENDMQHTKQQHTNNNNATAIR